MKSFIFHGQRLYAKKQDLLLKSIYAHLEDEDALEESFIAAYRGVS